MNILIHSHLFPNPVKPVFGTFVFYFAESLIQLGHKVTIISPIPYVPIGICRTHPWHSYKKVSRCYQKDDLIIYHPRFLSIPKRILLWIRGEIMYLSAWPFYNHLLRSEKFDIIHCHVALPDGVVGRYLSKKYKIPYGITVHGADFYESIPENRFNYQQIKKVLENASFIGLVSKRLQILMNEKNIKPISPHVRIIYNGVKDQKNYEKVFWNDNLKNPVRLLSVAHLTKRKGIEFVLKALAILKHNFQNVRYYVIGEGIDLEYFKNIAKAENVLNITYFLGAKNNREVLSYMKGCDIFLLPSWDESFGVVYIEAMSMGKITIGSLGEGIAEVIQDGVNGFLVKPRDVNDLVTKLNYVLSNINKFKRLKEMARSTVLPNFTWENNAKQYVEMYTKVLEKY